jgi:hypothetical protein
VWNDAQIKPSADVTPLAQIKDAGWGTRINIHSSMERQASFELPCWPL